MCAFGKIFGGVALLLLVIFLHLNVCLLSIINLLIFSCLSLVSFLALLGISILFFRNLRDGEIQVLVQLLACLESVNWRGYGDDCRIWAAYPSGYFSVKSFFFVSLC